MFTIFKAKQSPNPVHNKKSCDTTRLLSFKDNFPPEPGTLYIQRKPACACEGGCPRCRDSSGGGFDKRKNSNGRPLTPIIRDFFESRTGHNFTDIHLHTDNNAAESARAIGANAYTVGKHIFFGQNQYNPHTKQGNALLAHELVHSIQQQNQCGNIVQRQDTKPALSEEAEKIGKRSEEIEWSRTSAGLTEEIKKNEQFLIMNYAINSSEMKKEHQGFLLKTIYHTNWMLHPMSRIKIIGHACKTGSKEFNKKLSLKRAKNVAEELKASGVMAMVELRMDKIAGKGYDDPIADNSTVYGRARNRRVEIILVPWKPVDPLEKEIAGLTKGMKPYIISLENFSAVPFPEKVKAIIEEAFKAIPLIKFDWTGKLTGTDNTLEFDNKTEFTQALGFSGLVYLRSFNENQICKDNKDPTTCEKEFPHTAEIKGQAIANAAVHEIAHFMGLDHVSQEDNYMWTPELHPLWGKKKTFEQKVLVERTLQSIKANFNNEQLIHMIHFIKEQRVRAKRNVFTF